MTEPTPKRKNVSWRVGELQEHEKINRWIDEQSNIQLSLASLVLHMIDRFGYRNITDHDIQKILYQEPLLNGMQSLPLSQLPAINAIPDPQPAVMTAEKIATAATTPLQESNTPEEEKDEDDPDDPLLQQINPKSF